jgi:hypothetical protein
MDNPNDKFGSGFVAGAIFGSVVGGLMGAWLANKLSETSTDEPTEGSETLKAANGRLKRQWPSLRGGGELNIETARQGLETKIAQLNDAIDDVRSQLSNVNGRD